MVVLEAHKGVCTECPENTHAAFRKATEQGYKMIELDPNFTSDGKIVVLHDNTINRTARNSDGSLIEESIEIQSITYEQASRYDYGLKFSEDFRGEPLPLLADVFKFAEEYNVELKIDNKFEKFPPHMKETLYDMARNSKAKIGFTCSTVGSMLEVQKQIPNVPIHYDGYVDEDILETLTSAVKNLIVWAPYECKRTSWVKVSFASKKLCELIKHYALLGIWIITDDNDYHIVCEEFSPDYIETDGTIKPTGV